MGIGLEIINQLSIKHQNYQTSRISVDDPYQIQWEKDDTRMGIGLETIKIFKEINCGFTKHWMVILVLESWCSFKARVELMSKQCPLWQTDLRRKQLLKRSEHLEENIVFDFFMISIFFFRNTQRKHRTANTHNLTKRGNRTI